jgi:hypothetical protein
MKDPGMTPAGRLTVGIAFVSDSGCAIQVPATSWRTVTSKSFAHLVLFIFLAFSFLGAWVERSTILAEMQVETSKPKPVDPKIDNSKVRKSLVATLVVTIDIRDTKVSLRDLQVVMAPRPYQRREEKEELVVVTGISKGRRVSSVRIPDQRVNVEENKGLVIMKNRTVTAMLPLPKKIDHVEVTLPGDAKGTLLDVHETIDQFCKAHPRLPVCQAHKSEAVRS